MTGLYIHIPFCRQKCRYCDFPSYGGVEQLIPAYIDALCREISTSGHKGLSVDTVYFGGGTPSLLSVAQIEAVLTALSRTFQITNDAEITLEANPDSMDQEYAHSLHELGINRLSLGIQTFQPHLLRRLGRIHTARQARDAVEAAYQAGFTNLSGDLMYGLPEQTTADVAADLKTFLSLPLSHASIYSLILEEKTCLWHDVETDLETLPADEVVETMAEMVRQQLASHGFEHYEISSFAKPGYRSRHNCKYWQYEPYLSFGVSAHSFFAGCRSVHISNIPAYIRKAGRESVLAQVMPIDEKRGREDYCFLALRMRDGINYEEFRRHFGTAIQSVFGNVIDELIHKGLLEKTERGCRLTKTGLLYGNYVFSHFID